MKKKSILLVLFGLILGLSVAYAAELINSKDIRFSNGVTNLKANNVQDAIEELYDKTISDSSCKNVSVPKLGEGLVPVTIENDGIVKYADTSKKWYNYCDKIWANAVILEDNTSYKVGDIIQESDIQSYFVWIPKYKYKLWNVDTPSKGIHEIEIVFDENDTNKVIIKPNVYSWRNINVYNAFLNSYNYQRNLDSHMMKNIEWGAISYLSHSLYGKGLEININNNSSYKTGYSALPTTNQQTYPGTSGDGQTYNSAYNTEVGYLASTSGNISGVYDMSGGAWEYVSSYITGKLGSSGFSATTLANYDSKYFDVYNASSAISTYQYRILGDATGEMGPFKSYLDGDNTSRWHSSWYSDRSDFVDSSYPWFVRGGRYTHGELSGTVYFDRYTGGTNSDGGFRITLTP